MVFRSKLGSPGSTRFRRCWDCGSLVSRLGVVRRMPRRSGAAQRRDKAGRRPPEGLGLARREQRNRMGTPMKRQPDASSEAARYQRGEVPWIPRAVDRLVRLFRCAGDGLRRKHNTRRRIEKRAKGIAEMSVKTPPSVVRANSRMPKARTPTPTEVRVRAYNHRPSRRRMEPRIATTE